MCCDSGDVLHSDVVFTTPNDSILHIGRRVLPSIQGDDASKYALLFVGVGSTADANPVIHILCLLISEFSNPHITK